MIGKKYIDLMNAELDGVNSTKESDLLREYLASNREAHDHFEDLKFTIGRIDAGKAFVEPPLDLEQRIFTSICWGRRRSEGSGRSTPSWIARCFSAPHLRYAAAFTAGILIGVILYSKVGYEVAGGSLFDKSRLYGTMKFIESADGLEEIKSLDVEAGEVRGQIRLHESERALVAEVSLSSSDPIEWVLQFDEDDVLFEGFRHIDGKGKDCNIITAASEARVRQTGHNKYILFFSQDNHLDAPIVAKIYSADHSLLFERSLTRAAEK
jgi:hypothetical protein